MSQEISFDGVARTSHRDVAGRVRTLDRPSGVSSTYQYDAAGRVIGVRHSDGSEEGYRYRRDGALIRVINDSATVASDRDPLGRIVKESSGGDWVASAFDLLGRRTSVRSSKNFEQQLERNPFGDVLAVRAGNAQMPASDPVSGDPPVLPEALFEARLPATASASSSSAICPGACARAGSATTSGARSGTSCTRARGCDFPRPTSGRPTIGCARSSTRSRGQSPLSS